MLAVSLKTCPPPTTARRSIGPGGGHADATVEVARPLAEWLDSLPIQSGGNQNEGGSSDAQPPDAQQPQNSGGDNSPLPDFGSSECVTDLTRLEVMRHELSRLWTSPHSLRSSGAAHKLDDALSRSMEYSACLTECLRRNLGRSHVPSLVLPWRGAFVDTAHPLEREVHFGHSLTFEQYAVLFNIAAMEGCRASRFARSALAEGATQMERTKGLKGALDGFGRAASTYAHLRLMVERDTAEAARVAASEEQQAEDETETTCDSNHNCSANAAPKEPMAAIPPLSPDLTPGALHLCESLHLAHGQMCVYRTALLRPRPMHAVLAKVAAGAADLYDTARAHLLDPTPHDVYGAGKGGGGTDSENGGATGGAGGQQQQQQPVWPNLVSTLSDRVTSSWDGYLRAAGGTCRARAEWHESFSAAGKDKKDAVAELAAATENGDNAAVALAKAKQGDDAPPGPHESARLRRAIRWTDDAATALRMVEGGTVAFNAILGPGAAEIMSEEIRTMRASVVDKLEARSTSSTGPKDREREEGQMQRDQTDDDMLDLPPVIGQNMMKRLPKIHSDLDPAKLKRRMFTTLLGPGAKRVLLGFRSQLGTSLESAAKAAQRETDIARARLAGVNLPQSLDAYRASREAGGGVPPRMWEAIERVQSNDEIDLLKRNLWALKDVADHARSTLTSLVRHLDDDVEADRLFREENPSFRGHDAAQVQDPLRGQVRNWEGWLEQARNGDEKLLCVLNEFETEPKYQLLQCTRGQLEQLIPGRRGDESSADTGDIDTGALRASLEDLSNLIRDRQSIIEEFKAKAEAHELRPILVEINSSFMGQEGATGNDAANWPPTQAASPTPSIGVSSVEADFPIKVRRFEEAANAALQAFAPYLEKVQSHNAHQNLLMERILKENALFREALDQDATANRGQDYVQKLEDALLTVERVKTQLTEGRNFYDVVMPRLERLREEVSDLSARLVAERLEFMDRMEMSGDQEERRQREQSDAELAAKLAKEHNVTDESLPRQSTEELRRDEEVAAEMARRFREEQNQGASGESGSRTDQRQEEDRLSTATAGTGNTLSNNDGDRDIPSEQSVVERASNAENEATPVSHSSDALPTSEDGAHTGNNASDNDEMMAARRVSPAGVEDSSNLDREDGVRSRRASIDNRSRRESSSQENSLHSMPPSSPQPHRARTPPPPGQPGVYHVSNDSAPLVRVDDEKLARFVQMGFDSEKARKALQRFDNNESQALE
eukprot:CAMPEP_0113587808 /NCGR_PEP_ID=MMETSP0015_2-20120614/35125_1 /TAXON_ID=2838 /ORGANISM="Odontella" /LENGTH=1237 /DNA_ID=CAMNT_0000493531 /DNA_START=475 /DNA_END=4185 /DNA_ORIENTATION=- /assembly_acc=CAM_ASM_000160